jgi:uncharacterized RDD family membrane protein YckC
MAVMIVLTIAYTLVTSLIAGAATVAAAAAPGSDDAAAAALGMFGSSFCAMLVIYPIATFSVGAYNRVYLVSKRGYSIGQGVMKLKVVDTNGALLPMGSAALRLVSQVGLSVVPLAGMLDVLWPLWTRAVRRSTTRSSDRSSFPIRRANDAARGQPSLAGPATAIALLAEGGLLRAVLDADDARAYVLGHPIEIGCGLLARTGIPCPMCGITRALAFALKGELGHAFRLNPAAPIAVVGLFLVAIGLLAGAAVARVPGGAAASRFNVRARTRRNRLRRHRLARVAPRRDRTSGGSARAEVDREYTAEDRAPTTFTFARRGPAPRARACRPGRRPAVAHQDRFHGRELGEPLHGGEGERRSRSLAAGKRSRRPPACARTRSPVTRVVAAKRSASSPSVLEPRSSKTRSPGTGSSPSPSHPSQATGNAAVSARGPSMRAPVSSANRRASRA